MSERAGPSTEGFWGDVEGPETARRFQSVVNAVTDGIYQLDAEERFVAVNDVLLELTGHDREALLGANVSALLSDDDAERVDRAVAEYLEGPREELPPFELSLSTADGDSVPVELQVDPVVDDGEFLGTSGVARERTDARVPADDDEPPRAVRESIAGVVDEPDVGVFVLDENFDVAWIDDDVERYFGLDRETAIGRDKRELIDETITDRIADGEAFAETVRATYDDNSYVEQFTCRVTSGEDRAERWLEHRSNPIESGEYEGGRVELYFDVTDQKERERELEHSEQRFRSLVQAVDEYAIFMLDPDGRVVNWNDGAESIKGYDTDSIVGEHFSAFYTDEDFEASVPERNLEAARREGSIEEEGWRVRADGSRFWANVTITAVRDDDGSLQGFAKVTRDMTDRREHERRLERERDLTDRILETSPVGTVVLDSDGELTRMNERGREILQIDDGESLEAGDRPLYTEDGEPLAVEDHPFARTMRDGEAVYDELLQVELPDGERRWLSVSATAITTEDGEVDRVVTTGEDVTAIKERERNLERRSEALSTELDEIYGRITDAFMALDDDWEFTHVNERAEEIIGADADELLGENIWEEFPALEGSRFKECYREAMETQRPASVREYYPPLDAWLEDHVYPSESGLSVYFRDVSDQVQREEELRRSEDRLRLALDSAELGVWELDLQSGASPVRSARHDRIFGYEEQLDDWSVERFLEHVHPEDRPDVRQRLEDATESGEWRFECRIVRADGAERWIAADGEIEFDEDGEPDRAVGVVRDVTERKERERELERYETIVQTVDDGIYTVDEEGHYTWVNDSYASMIGYDPEELVGEHVSLVVDDDLAEAAQEVERGMRKDDLSDPSLEAELVPTAGEPFTAEATFSLLPDGDRAGVVRDISERKAMEEELREERDLVGGIVETSPVGITVVDADGEMTFSNERAEEILGLSKAEIDTFSYDDPRWDLVDDRGEPFEGDETIFERVWADEEPVFDHVLGLRRPSGERVWLSVNGAPRYEDGEKTGAVFTLADVTEQRRLEGELEEILGRVSDAFYALDEEFRFTHVNDEAEELLQADEEELVGEQLWELFPEAADVEDVWDAFHTAMETQEPQSYELYFDVLEFWVHARIYPSETGVSVYFRDVTERKERERELEESERRYRTLAEHFPNGIVTLVDDDLEYTLAAGQGFEAIPVEPDDVEGEAFQEVWDEETVASLEPALEAALDGEESAVELTYADREWIVRAVPVTDDEGEVLGGMTMAQDVTDQKERERALEEAKAQLEAATEAGAIGTWQWDVDDDSMVTGESFARTFDIDPEEAREGTSLETFVEAIHDDDRERVEREIEAAVESCGDYEAEYRVRNADGDVRWVLARGHVECEDGEAVTFPGSLVDITDRKRAEIALEEHREQLETLFEVLPVGVVVADADGELLEANEVAEEIWGGDVFDAGSVGEYDRYRGWWADTGEPIEPEEWTMSRVLEGEAVTEPDTIEIENGDGDRRIVMIHGMPVYDDAGEVTRGVVTQTDVTERRRAERRLEESERRHRTLVENFPQGAVALFDEDLEYTAVGGELVEDVGVDPADRIGARVTSIYPDELVDQIEPEFEAALDGESNTFQAELHDRHLLANTVPVRDGDGEVYAGMLVVQDISEREEAREKLQRQADQQAAVAALGQLALETDDLDDLMSEASRLVSEALDIDYCKVLDLDDESRELLLRQGVGWRDGIVGEATVGADEDDSQAGYTLRAEEPVVVEDLASEPRFSGPELLTSHDVTSGISTIIGSVDDPWGILGTHDTAERTFTDEDVDFVQSVANVLATAIERQRHERLLERQREQLTALNRLNDAVRATSLAAATATSREEIEERVCEQLAATDPFVFAWVGHLERGESTVTPSARAGHEDGYLEEASVTVDDAVTGEGPTGRAFRTGDPQVVDDVETDPEFEPWREVALERGYRSTAALPIVHDGSTYGVLNVYADEPGAFAGHEGELLVQLAELVGHSIHAVEQREALVTDSITELEFLVTADDHALLEATAGSDASISVDRRVPAGGDDYVNFLTVSGMDPEPFREVVEADPSVEDVEHLAGSDAEHRFELTMNELPISSALADHGGRLSELTIADGAFRVVTEVPSEADVREVLGSVESVYADVELLAQRTTVRSETSREEIESVLSERLTDKQRAALEAAYFAGYFEWPRVSNGEEVADLLGVSPATFTQHLRSAELKLFDAVFEEQGAAG